MRVGVVGLGLMGGSAAKCLKKAGCEVLGYNRNKSVVKKAIDEGVLSLELDKSNIKKCDLIILANPLDGAIDYIKDNAQYFENFVIDFCGIKEKICFFATPLSKKYGFTFIGTHPMCGTNKSGWDNSFDSLFRGATMAITPQDGKRSDETARLEKLLEPFGFGRFVYATAQEHDRIIAYTSQMAHCITTSFVKSPTALVTKSIRSGGFNDMSRLASLVPSMWSELLVENSDNIVCELDTFINNITLLKEAIKAKDKMRVENILQEGVKAKENIDRG